MTGRKYSFWGSYRSENNCSYPREERKDFVIDGHQVKSRESIMGLS